MLYNLCFSKAISINYNPHWKISETQSNGYINEVQATNHMFETHRVSSGQSRVQHFICDVIEESSNKVYFWGKIDMTSKEPMAI